MYALFQKLNPFEGIFDGIFLVKSELDNFQWERQGINGVKKSS